MSARFKLVSILIILLLIAILSSINRLDDISPKELKVQAEGSFVIKRMARNYFVSGIKQVVSDPNNIYVVFGTRGIVNVYSESGEYKYSIAVHDYTNGRVKIAVDEERLYIRDKVNNIYIFSEENLLQFVPNKEAILINDTIDFNSTSKDYIVYRGSLWKVVSEGNDTCVIQRPFWLSLHQHSLGTFIMLGLLAMVGGILFLKRK